MKKGLLMVAAMFAAFNANAQGVWSAQPEGCTNNQVIAVGGAPTVVETPIKNAKIALAGATDWTAKSDYDEASTFVAPTNNVTYNKGYIQGGTNGSAGGSLDKSGSESSHVEFTPEIAGTVYVVAKYGKAKDIWFCKVPKDVIDNEELDNATIGSSYAIEGYNGKFISNDGTKTVDAAEAEADVYTALPVAVEPGFTYYFFVVGSKLMLCGLDFQAGTAGINDVKVASTSNAATFNLAGQKVSKDYKGVVVVNGKKFVQK